MLDIKAIIDLIVHKITKKALKQQFIGVFKSQ
jgi:hypothetical protein